jgi:hypothetical protein
MIDDQDILDLATWVAYDKNLVVIARDDVVGFRKRRGLWSTIYVLLGLYFGNKFAGTPMT